MEIQTFESTDVTDIPGGAAKVSSSDHFDISEEARERMIDMAREGLKRLSAPSAPSSRALARSAIPPEKSLSKSINSFLNIDCKDDVAYKRSDPFVQNVEQPLFTATETTQILDVCITSVDVYAVAVPANTGQTATPNYPVAQFLQYDELNQLIGIVGTFPLRTLTTSPFYLQNIHVAQGGTFSNECYIFLQKGQSIRVRIPYLSATIFNGITLDISLFKRSFPDSLTFKSFYRVVSPSDFDRGIPTFVYQNTTADKQAIVLTPSQCGSTSYEPFVMPQQLAPNNVIRYSFYYGFDVEGNYTNYLFNNVPAAAFFEGFVTTYIPRSPANIVTERMSHPFNSNRILPGEGLRICYDANPAYDSGIPVLISFVVLEI